METQREIDEWFRYRSKDVSTIPEGSSSASSSHIDRKRDSSVLEDLNLSFRTSSPHEFSKRRKQDVFARSFACYDRYSNQEFWNHLLSFRESISESSCCQCDSVLLDGCVDSSALILQVCICRDMKMEEKWYSYCGSHGSQFGCYEISAPIDPSSTVRFLPQWVWPVADRVECTPSLFLSLDVGPRLCIAVGDYQGRLYAWDALSGELCWFVHLDADVDVSKRGIYGCICSAYSCSTCQHEYFPCSSSDVCTCPCHELLRHRIVCCTRSGRFVVLADQGHSQPVIEISIDFGKGCNSGLTVFSTLSSGEIHAVVGSVAFTTGHVAFVHMRMEESRKKLCVNDYSILQVGSTPFFTRPVWCSSANVVLVVSVACCISMLDVDTVSVLTNISMGSALSFSPPLIIPFHEMLLSSKVRGWILVVGSQDGLVHVVRLDDCFAIRRQFVLPLIGLSKYFSSLNLSSLSRWINN